MKKIFTLILLFFVTACSFFSQDEEKSVAIADNEKIYVKMEGLDNTKNHKLVFIQHGLASNSNHPAVQAAKKAFLNNGYVVVSFDSRYSLGKSGNDVEKVSLSSFYDDLETITKWAKTQPFYSEPFAVSGHSLGGASVIEYAAANQEKVNILIPITPVISGTQWEKSCMTNMSDFCHQWKKSGFYKYTDGKNNKTAIIPYSVVTNSKAYNAVSLAAKIPAKTLLVAAQNDIIINPTEVENLAKKLPNAHEVEIKSSGHNFEDKQNQVDLYSAINSFLQQF